MTLSFKGPTGLLPFTAATANRHGNPTWPLANLGPIFCAKLCARVLAKDLGMFFLCQAGKKGGRVDFPLERWKGHPSGKVWGDLTHLEEKGGWVFHQGGSFLPIERGLFFVWEACS